VGDWENSIWKKKYETYLQRIFEEDQVSIYSPITEVELEDELEDERRVQTWISGGSSGEESEEESGEESEEEREELTTNEKLKNLMDYIFEKGEDLPNGIYLELCNRLKDIHETL
jgi:hypothetical protein